MVFWTRGKQAIIKDNDTDILTVTLPKSGQDIPLRLRINNRAKRLTMRFCTKTDQLQMTTPPWAAQSDISSFIGSHEGWILSQINKAPDRIPFEDGITIPYRNRPTLITHEEGRGRPVTYLEDENRFIVRGDIHHLPRRLTTWLKKDIKDTLTAYTDANSKTLGVPYGKITIRDQTSRWGSCAANGNLNYNWRIIFAPDVVIHYLCAHECAHLIEMNHSPAFWKVTESLCQTFDPPQSAETSRAWLRQNGSKLFRIGT